jgi:predicted O-methyltransferase YrrM
MSYADIPGFMAPEVAEFYSVMASRVPHDGAIVEVGVAYGRSLAYLVEALAAVDKRNVRVFGVDVWSDFMGCERDDWIGERARALKAIYESPRAAAAAQLEVHCPSAMNVARLVHMASLAASLALAPHGPFDLVFIDAEHTYESIAADVVAWEPHVKRGGVLAGDDYDADMFPGLVRGVDKFVKARSQTFTTRGRVWMHEVK